MAEQTPNDRSGADDRHGTEVEVSISTVAHGGVFVARHDGRVIFVSDAVPGERVLARITDTKHDRFWRADTVRVIEPSSDRQAHIWPEASIDRDPDDRAGGAEFGHIAPRRQRQLKQQVLRESMQRFAKVDGVDALIPEVEALPGETDGTGWRTRVRLHVAADGAIGPYSSRSHRVIEVADLPLATQAVRDAAPLGIPHPGATAIDIVAPSDGDVRVLIAEERDSGRAGRDTIAELVGERRFELAQTGFWQVHSGAALALTQAVQGAIDDQLFDPAAANLDLYGGVGLLAAAVGDRFGPATRITSVESDATATDYAQSNLADWLGASAVTARVDRFVSDLNKRADKAERTRLSRATIVLDPPRSGAGKNVMRGIVSLAPAQMIYVACDPVALARDVGIAAEHGYRLTALRAFDLFPNTHHVEAVATLVRD